MIRILTALVSLFCVLGLSAERVDYFATSFSDGLPPGTLTLDRDAQTLHFTMVQAGFDQGDSWRVFTSDGNSYAASPARHKTAKGETPQAADDWMVLPPVRIMDRDAMLEWQGATLAESINLGCSYEVRVSTTGGDPEDFNETPLLSVEAEGLEEWNHHELSLAAYAGQQIWIAFVHTSLNREILALDDVCVSGSPGLYRLTSKVPAYHFGEEPLRLTASVQATSTTALQAFTVYCDCGGEVMQQSYSGLNLTASDDAFDVVFEEPVKLRPGEVLRYRMWMEVEGNASVEQPAVVGTTESYLFEAQHRTLVEEGTGMWCTYCPRGIVAMKQMREKYPDTFIGVAVHYDDALGATQNIADYCSEIHFPSFPSAYVNRVTLCGDPYPVGTNGQHTLLEGGLESCFLAEQTIPAPADLSLTWTKLSDGKWGVAASARFAIHAADCDYRFAAIAVEDGVSGAGFYQTNFYSGSGMDMGGFEALPTRIPNYTFEEVARALLLPYEGAAGSIPPHVRAGETYSYAFEVANVPYNNLSNVRVVLMLLDATTGRVVNAVQASSASAKDYDEAMNGIAPLPLLSPAAVAPAYGLDGRLLPAELRGIVVKQGRKHFLQR